MNTDRIRPADFDRPSDCPDPEAVLSYHRGLLSAGRRKAVARHLRRCLSCRQDSAFVVATLLEESRLLQEIEALLPVETKCDPRAASAPSRRSPLRAPRWMAAAAAAAGMAMALIAVLSLKNPALPGPVGPAQASYAGTLSGSTLAPRLFPKPSGLRDRLLRSVALLDADAGGDRPASIELHNALSSFEIAPGRSRSEEFYGWSLVSYAETSAPSLTVRPR